MSITVVARKLLWGRAVDECSFPDCTQSLTAVPGDIEAGVLESQGVIIGEEAHVRSSKNDGPRYERDFPPDQIDSYANLILLCPTHHTVIDAQNGAGWPTGVVLDMKQTHEADKKGSRSLGDAKRLELEERIAALLATWESKLGIDAADDWDGLTFGLNYPVPLIRPDRLQRLVELGQWLLRRSWPPDLEKVTTAFARHFSVVQTLLQTLEDVMLPDDHRWELNRLYRHLDRWDPEAYKQLLRETNLRAITLWYLTTELARSANLIITAVRDEFDPLYRFDEGVVLTRDGDGLVVNQVFRDEYVQWDWDAPAQFPTIAEIRSAIELAATDSDSRLTSVDPRGITPTGQPQA